MTTIPTPELATPWALPADGHRQAQAGVWVEVYSRAQLPTRYGTFTILVFRSNQDDKEQVALVRGALPDDGAGVTVRVHSECLTGDALASLRCDCREQLELILTQLGQAEAGVLLYLRQEGRGIGLGNKIRAYRLQQEQGLDTVDANRHLGFDDDLRDYAVAALMLRALGVRSVQLATNNPRKIFGLRAYGVEVLGRLPLVVPQNPHNADYLATKARKSGHILPIP